MSATTQTQLVNLLPLNLADDGIQLAEIEIFTEPRLPLAVVFYTDNGQPQELGLRLDIGKLAFLDIDPFETRWGETEGRNRANTFASIIVKHLALPGQVRSASMAHGD